MNTTQTTNKQSSEAVDIINACVNAIESSIDHFLCVQGHIQKLTVLLQEDDKETINGINAISKQPKNYEPLCLNKVNYIAILALEKLGISGPSQQQIDTMEIIILLSIEPGRIDQEKAEYCLNNEALAKHILQCRLMGNC